MSDTRWKVLIGSRAFGKAFPEHITVLEEAGCLVIPNTIGRSYHEAELLQLIGDVDAIIVGTDEITKKVINSAKRLKTIAKLGVGLSNVDLDAAWEAGITVTVTPGTVHDSVADHIMTLTLSLARKIIPTHLAAGSSTWTPFFGFELRNKIFGLIGLGRIGKAVCQRARAFGLRLIAYEQYPDFDWLKQNGVDLVSIDDLVKKADIVSLHVPLTSVEGPIITAKRLATMKNTALLINTARSGMVDEIALLHALQTGALAGAGLDMFSEQADIRDALLNLPNVVLTPQSAGNTLEVQQRMGEMAIENCLRALKGEIPLHPVWKEER